MINTFQDNYDRDINIDQIVGNINALSKKQVLQELSNYAADAYSMPASLLAEQLWDQEGLENSAVGSGLAMPVLKLAKATKPYSVFARLSRPIEFGAMDRQNVDLICLLVVSESEGPVYLRRLSRLTRLFQNQELCEKIRETTDMQAIRSLIQNPDGWMLAA